MLCLNHINPINYVTANAAQVLRDLAERHDVLINTKNGKATTAMKDIAS